MGLRLNGDSPKYIDIVFEGEQPTLVFVEVEDDYRNSIKIGQWLETNDGMKRLRIRKGDF
jgi:hypothetical protein